jgi:diguanylate cyclase (GGDEF)-like protein
MEKLRELVLKCLDEYKDEDRLIEELNQIAEKEGSQVYPIIFDVLADLYLEPEDALQRWDEIILLNSKLSDQLGRTVSLRTAVCDYFYSIQKTLKNPKVVEIQTFETTLKASRIDSMTGLYNRQLFDETLKRELHRAKRHNLELSVLFFDLDDFKAVNDVYGHQVGDKVLKNVARIILEEKRAEDFAARYGGEELVVILPETGKMNALVMGERIRWKVKESAIVHKGKKIRITISGGLASYPVNASSAAELLKCADQALYRAKGSGKNNISLFSEDKRRYLRIDLNRDVKIRELEFTNGEVQTARVKNICIGGILFENESPIPIGTRVQVNIPVRRKKPLIIIGDVIRVEESDLGKYDIGVSISFLEMDKALKDEVSKWLQTKRPTSPTDDQDSES